MRKITSVVLVLMILLSLCLTACHDSGNGQHTAHVDQNDDGACDQCEVSVLVNFDFYAINDLHGKFDDTDNQPGVDELTSYLRAAQFANENTILLSSGDMWQGSSESNLTKGHMITEWMNDLGFVSMTLGNHEYDWGEDIIRENEGIAEFPFLGINIYNRETKKRVEYCEPSVMVDMNGLQIGIIGAIGDCYSSIASDWTQDIYFLVDDDLTKLVRDEASRLRQEGADFIVLSIHDGSSGGKYSDFNSYYNTSLSNGYVDLVFEAHTHQYYVKEDHYGVHHVQGGGDNQGIVHVDLDINSVTGTAKVNQAKFVSTDDYKHYSDDPVVDKLLEKYEEQVSIGQDVLGHNSVSKSRNQLRQIAANLYYDYGMDRWGRDYNIVLGGGFFSVRSPGYLKPGDVTYAQLYMLFPFDNDLVLCSIKGRDLRSKFFETDNDNYFICYGDYGMSIMDNIDPDATYYVVVDTYTSTYAYNNLTEIERSDEHVYLRDLLAQYISDGFLE